MGGIAAVVTALIIAGAGVAVVMWDRSGDDGAAGDGDETGASAPHAYTLRDDICVAVDLSPAEDLAGSTNILHDDGYEMFSIWTWACDYSMRNDDVWGRLSLTIDVYPDVAAAEREFDRSGDSPRDFFDRVEDAPGPWQQGRVFTKDDSDDLVGSITVLYQVQDSNLAVEARFHCVVDPGVELEPEMRTTVGDVIVNVMTAHAA